MLWGLPGKHAPGAPHGPAGGRDNSPLTMISLRLLSAVIAVTAASAAFADTPAKDTARTEVVFDHPENFTDVKDSDMPTDRGRDEILSRIRNFMVERSDSLLPAGYHLRIVFTDIDLAGDFEPWRSQQWSDVRIIKDVYPPAFKFTYTVTDAAGRTVKEGSVNIRDLSFQTRMALPQDDSLRYEKDILGDWARGALRGLKKG